MSSRERTRRRGTPGTRRETALGKEYRQKLAPSPFGGKEGIERGHGAGHHRGAEDGTQGEGPAQAAQQPRQDDTPVDPGEHPAEERGPAEDEGHQQRAPASLRIRRPALECWSRRVQRRPSPYPRPASAAKATTEYVSSNHPGRVPIPSVDGST